LGKQNVRFSPSSALQKSGLLSSAFVRTASLQDRKIRWPLHAGGRRAQLRARAFDPDPQGGQGADDLVTGVREGDRGESLPDYLGVPKFRYGEVEPNDRVGVVTGLAWTASAASCSPSKA